MKTGFLLVLFKIGDAGASASFKKNLFSYFEFQIRVAACEFVFCRFQKLKTLHDLLSRSEEQEERIISRFVQMSTAAGGTKLIDFHSTD